MFLERALGILKICEVKLSKAKVTYCGMGRKIGNSGCCDKAAAAGGVDGVGSSSCSDDAVVPVKVPSWEDLVEMAEAALDDEGETKMEKRRRTAEKKIRRMKERKIREVVDVGALRKGLCAYYADVTGGGKVKGFRKVVSEFGVSVGDYFGGAEDRYADLKLVHEYIRGLMVAMAKDDAEETVMLAQAAQRRLITEEGCGLNQRAVEVSLKATMKDMYGPGDENGDEKRKPVVYNLPGLTLNMIMSPGELTAKNLDGSRLVSEVIDV